MSRQFDPFRYHRRSIRYKDWDYRTPGFYFLTICTAGRQRLFDDPRFREIVERRIQKLPGSIVHVQMDVWIVMPDHVHFIVWLIDWPEGISAESEKRQGLTNVQAGSVGAIVSSLKSQVSREINDLRDGKGNSVWQRGYWDRIVRHHEELDRIRHYIRTNPERWDADDDDLDALLHRMTHHA